VVKPEEITPGVANWYASSFNLGGDFASILVKTREGRPIFIKPNDAYPEALRGVSARANASVLELYDDNRYQDPQVNGESSSWDEVDAQIAGKLNAIKAKGGKIRILMGSTSSPSTMAAIKKFEETFGGEREVDEYNEFGDVIGKLTIKDSMVVNYDADSYNGIISANTADFGVSKVPSFDFTKAKVVVGVNADFLGSWLDSTANAKGYAQKRNPDNAWMSRHFQFETNMTMTGASADVRGAIKPSETGEVIKALYNQIVGGGASANVSSSDDNQAEKIKQAASELKANKGASLLVCGSNNPAVQQLVNAINNHLGNYGQTISLARANNNFRSNNVTSLIEEMNQGKVDALFVYNCNPLFSLPASSGFSEAMGKVGLTVSFADRPDETSTACQYVCPDHFYLESWNDYQPYTGIYTLAQPTIKNLFRTRQAQSSLLTWTGADADYYKFIKENWKANILSGLSDQVMAEDAFNRALQSGVYVVKNENTEPTYSGDAVNASKKITASTGNWEVQFYFSNAIGDGTQANNPHLQELPDPINKISWDNYVAMAPSDMREMNLEMRTAEATPANLVNVTVNGVTLTLPAVASPGQKKGTVGIALGYGREVSGKVGTTGVNAFPALSRIGDLTSSDVAIESTGETYAVASIQTHHTMMGRKIVNETSIDTFKNVDKNDKLNGWNKDVKLADAFGREQHVKDMNLWDDHGIDLGHRWGMSVDLNACNGCGACVTACHIENNVPVVGKDEIRRTRSMFWLRVDRYYSSDMTKETAKENGVGAKDMYAQMENPSDYPDVVFQPVMCQHCNHAPCETVCPVAATTHSEEGLNQMAYNRCVGTRYCANNCPYKVRRFNWFNYVDDSKFDGINPAQNDLARMVLNPDVVVRSRGVIEKCSFCVQKIQAGKLVAKKAGRPVEDGDVVSACAEACPTNAIAFGDLNDKNSKVRESFENDRAYFLIEEVGTQPNVSYMTKVRNRKA
jgi:molybdopterin-containing oxidoreductase family iron-sulfur binding subunit